MKYPLGSWLMAKSGKKLEIMGIIAIQWAYLENYNRPINATAQNAVISILSISGLVVTRTEDYGL